MQSKLPHPEHASYARHRRERNLQIILPVVVSAILLLLVVIGVTYATFNTGGDVSRWAAVSTIWLVIPVILGKLITLILLLGLIYGMQQVLSGLPYYTGITQDYIYLARTHVIRGADAISGALIKIEGQFARIKSFIQRIVP